MQKSVTAIGPTIPSSGESSNLTPAVGTTQATAPPRATSSTWDWWRYSGGRRDLRWDAIRGLAVLVMIIDHLGGAHSWLYLLTGHDRFFISAAEPFIFVSGLVMGLVYSRIVASQGLAVAIKKALKRAATLYFLTVGVGLTFAAISLQLGLPWAPRWPEGGMGSYVLDIITFQRAYYLTDVLILYTLLVLVAAPVIALLARGYAWLVLFASWALWTAWQTWPQYLHFPWRVADNDMFQFSPWQLLFFTALIIGFHAQALQRVAWRTRTLALRARLPKGALLPITLALTGTLIAASIAAYLWIQQTPTSTDDLAAARLFEKANMRAGRLAVFALFILFAFAALTLFWRPVKRLIGWLLLPFGQHALFVFTLHLFTIALVAKVAPLISDVLGVKWEAGDPTHATVAQIAGVALLWFAARSQPRWRISISRSWTGAKSLARAATRSGSLHVGGKKNSPQLSAARMAAISVALVLTVGVGVALLTQGDAVARKLLALEKKGTNTIAVLTTATARSPVLAPPPQATVGDKEKVAVPSPTPTTPTTTPTTAKSVTPASTPETITPQPTSTEIASGRGGDPTPLLPTPSPTPTIRSSPGIEAHNFTSPVLGREMPYMIYLPPDYHSNPDKRYPVLYMLHGIGGQHGEWAELGLLTRADEAIRSGQIDPFLIVLPQGDQSYWMDHANDGPPWGAYLVQDVVGEIDAKFRTIAGRDHRAVGGLSMGAHAALQLPINYPDVFGIAGAHSPSLYPRDRLPAFFGDDAYFRAHNPAHLYAARPEIARTLTLWIDLGEEDPWLSVITGFHDQLQSDGVQHEWRTYPGKHMAEYWAIHIVDYLNFYNQAFKAK